MDFYRHIDRNKVQFDFLTSVDEKGYFDDEIQKLGGKLYRAYPLKKNPIKNYLDIMRIVKENKYNIVHRHTGSAFGYYDLRAARRGDAKHLILHSHNPQVGKPILHFISEKLLKIDCIPVACSKEALYSYLSQSIALLIILTLVFFPNKNSPASLEHATGIQSIFNNFSDR